MTRSRLERVPLSSMGMSMVVLVGSWAGVGWVVVVSLCSMVGTGPGYRSFDEVLSADEDNKLE